MAPQKKTAAAAGKVSSSVLPMLPPCRICSEKASGFHYGVNTCEACKAFFRRSLEKGSNYKCIENENCEILPGKRNACTSCRFNKCLELGMCKEAIKTGRYTHEKKAEDIKEVKGFDKTTKKQMTTTNPSLSSTSSYNFNLMTNEPMSYESVSSPKTISSSSNVVISSDENLYTIINSIVHSYCLNTHYTPEFFEKLPEREREFLEQQALQCEVFGPLNPLPKEDYIQIYQTTGIDIDGRKELFQNEIPFFEQSIKRFIAFAKSIPGFNDLPVHDQITILKNSKFEVWMILCHRAFNPEHKLYVSQSDRICSFEEMTKLNDYDFVESIFSVQRRIKRLNLTQEESCMLAAFALMLTDDCVITDTAIADKSQDVLLKCLFCLFQKRQSNGRMRFAEVISCMVQLRTVKKEHSKAEEKLVKDWVGEIEFPPLLYEIWSS